MNIVIKELLFSSQVVDAEALEQFQKDWDTYQKLVDSNGLYHREVGEILRQELVSLRKEPFSFLDIACGDAGQMKRVLGDLPVKQYRGIDLSEPALELAAKNLADVPFPVELDHCDFVKALTDEKEPTDLAWCSLSIHHLQTDEKLQLMEEIRRQTSSGLMIYEPSMSEGENREEFLQRFQRVCKPAWNFYSEEEWNEIYHHVETCDFPETFSNWLDLGRSAGFSHAEVIFRDPLGMFFLYRFLN